MYYDLCLNYENPKDQDIEKLNDLAELFTSLIVDGYKIFAINTQRKGVISPNEHVQTKKQFDLKQFYSKFCLKFVNAEICEFVDFSKFLILNRLTLEIANSKEMYQFSNPNDYLMSFDILAVYPRNEQMFESSCKDLNVDIIVINFEEKINFYLLKRIILSAIDRGVFFEIQYGDFIKDTLRRSVFISNVTMLFEITKGKNLILSSGVSSFFHQRSPFDLVNLFETIFEQKSDSVKRMISENCEKVLIKAAQRKYFKQVMNLVKAEDDLEQEEEMGNDKNEIVEDKMEIDNN